MAMTPRARSAADSEASLARAPRSLNELVTWRFSYLTKTSAPVSADSRGAGSIGVRRTWPAITRRAASISANPTVRLRVLKKIFLQKMPTYRQSKANRTADRAFRLRHHHALAKPAVLP